MLSTKPIAFVAAAFAVGSALTSCKGASDGDCNPRIVFEDVTYRTHNLTKNAAPTESSGVGLGEVVGCDGERVDQVEIYQIRGVDLNTAIAVMDSNWQGLYVQNGTTPADWPSIRRKVS